MTTFTSQPWDYDRMMDVSDQVEAAEAGDGLLPVDVFFRKRKKAKQKRRRAIGVASLLKVRFLFFFFFLPLFVSVFVFR